MRESLPQAKGRVRAHRVPEGVAFDLSTPTTNWGLNTVLYDWGGIVGPLLTEGLSNYKIGGLYLEYKNVTTAGDTVAPPTFDRTADISYYQNLSGSLDYLRVPLIATTMSSSDATLYPNNNVATFFAQSSGTTGAAHSLNFGDSYNSTVFGAALVAFVDANDATQDLLLSRFYFDTADQQIKLATSQIGLEWELTLQ